MADSTIIQHKIESYSSCRTHLELVEDGSFTSSIETEHEQSILFVAKETVEKVRDDEAHSCT